MEPLFLLPTRRSQTRGAAATQTRGAAATQTRGAAATQTRGAAATQTRGASHIWIRRRVNQKVCQRHGLPSQDHGEPKRELCHHHGDRLLVDSFIPMSMESPRGSSAIIMEFRRRTDLIKSYIFSHVSSLGIFKDEISPSA